jgi:hypothetical protein
MRRAISALNLCTCPHGDDAMHIFGYVAIGFLIVCMLLAGTKALSVDAASMVIGAAGMAQVVAPVTTQSPRQASPSPIFQQQNQTDSALERLQDRAEGEEDLLNILD